ncbi:GtrA family protein [Vibrio sp. RE86]|uniref:GtrA family protein n=1 Tax=Vibrio sp. RE86 TaxID=2607605 RepID=UPI0014935D9D|nr:GtrA family protein [Vibrio sp. RE86]NOH79527.1 GtrA family protein [Vibrio sp. RE86]
MNSKLLRFALVGSIGFIADAFVFSVAFYLVELALTPARLIAFICAATVTWLGNRRLTFSNQEPNRFKQWLKFMLGASVSALPNFAMFKGTLWLLGEQGVIPMLALVAGILAGMVSNYLISAAWVFKSASAQ